MKRFVDLLPALCIFVVAACIVVVVVCQPPIETTAVSHKKTSDEQTTKAVQVVPEPEEWSLILAAAVTASLMSWSRSRSRT